MNMRLCIALLRQHYPLHPMRKKNGQFDPGQDSIKVLTLHASKGLEFPVVVMMGVGYMPAGGKDEREEVRLFYVGASG
jgi:superfamily I DNA/RNA helicase